MDKEIKLSIPVVTVVDLERLANRIKRDTNTSETELTFELVLANLFPTCWRNIKEEMARQYTLGYTQGYKDRGREIADKNNDDVDCYCE